MCSVTLFWRQGTHVCSLQLGNQQLKQWLHQMSNLVNQGVYWSYLQSIRKGSAAGAAVDSVSSITRISTPAGVRMLSAWLQVAQQVGESFQASGLIHHSGRLTKAPPPPSSSVYCLHSRISLRCQLWRACNGVYSESPESSSRMERFNLEEIATQQLGSGVIIIIFFNYKSSYWRLHMTF